MNRPARSLIAWLIFVSAMPGIGLGQAGQVSQGGQRPVALASWAMVAGAVGANPFPARDALLQPAPAPAQAPWEEPLLPGPIYSSRELTWRSSLILMLKVDKAGDLLVEKVVMGTWEAKAPPPLPAGIVWQQEAMRGIGYWRLSGKELELLPSGLRSEGPADSVEYASPKALWRLVPGAGWQALVKSTLIDLEQIQELKAAWAEPQAPRRIEKIQNWIERHESTLGGGITEGQGTGWGSLEQHALMEIIQNADLESAWKAVGVYARSSEGHLPPCAATFGTPNGRAFLLQIAQAPARLTGERARAIRLLGAKGMWNEAVTPDETRKFNELLILGLKQADPVLFDAARDSATSLAAAHPGALADPARETLKDLYQKQDPGPRKAALARAAAAALGALQWKALSGNEAGMVVAFTQLSATPERIQWKIERLHGESPAQKVTLVREKLGTMGKVVETASSPAQEMDNPPWVSFGPLRGEWPMQAWSGGLWRIKAIGGDPKKPVWQSETRLVRVVKPFPLPLSSGSGIGPSKVTIDPPAEK